MKIQITNYVFDKSAKTVTFTDYTTIRLDSLLLITNVTDGVIVYNFASPTLGGTVSGNVLTLTYDTSSMSDSDKLQIFYDDSSIQPANTTNQTELAELTETLQELVSRLNVIASMANSGVPALRAMLMSGSTTAVTGSLTTAGTVSTVSNVTNLGGVPAYTTSVATQNLLPALTNVSNVTA